MIKLLMKSEIAYLYRFFVIAVLHLVMTGCGGGGGSGSSGGSSNPEPISTKAIAEFTAEDIQSALAIIIGDMATGSYTDESVDSSVGGSATVTGVKSVIRNVDCGSDCVRSETDINMTVTASGLKVNTASNTETTLTGTIVYTDTTWSRQSGLSYSSGGSIGLSISSPVEYLIEEETDNFSYQGTITYLSSSGNSFSQSGQMSVEGQGDFVF